MNYQSFGVGGVSGALNGLDWGTDPLTHLDPEVPSSALYTGKYSSTFQLPQPESPQVLQPFRSLCRLLGLNSRRMQGSHVLNCGHYLRCQVPHQLVPEPVDAELYNAALLQVGGTLLPAPGTNY